MAATPPAVRTVRAEEILGVARELLEEAGFDGLRMRTLASKLGIKAPSLYAHFRDKREIENALIAQGLREQVDAQQRTRDEHPELDEITAIWRGYRDWALENPALHKLIAARALDREDAEVVAAEAAGIDAVVRSTGGHPAAGVAFWAFAYGMVELELNQRVPPGRDLEAVWAFGLRALAAELPQP